MTSSFSFKEALTYGFFLNRNWVFIVSTFQNFVFPLGRQNNKALFSLHYLMGFNFSCGLNDKWGKEEKFLQTQIFDSLHANPSSPNYTLCIFGLVNYTLPV